MFATLVRVFRERRVGLARAALVLVVVAAALHLHKASPGDVQLEFMLGPGHADVVELQVAYVQAGELVRAANFRYPEGAPARVPHRASLTPGAYEVRFELRKGDGAVRHVTRRLETPTQGRTRFEL